MRLLPLFFATVILFFDSSSAAAQSFARDLNGFRLGQAREVTHNALGRPDKADSSESGIYYEAFLMSEEPLLYMVFQYHESEPESIWSIQITGQNDKHDVLFRGLRLGQSPYEVEKILGKPTKKLDVAEHGTRWEYAGANYSVEISQANRLSSIRIANDRDAKADTSKLPKFADIVKKLSTATNAELAEILAPDAEIYEAGKTLSFQHPIKKEIDADTSGVFATVRRLSKELSQVDPKKSDHYEELTRIRQDRDPLHVIKLWKLKSVAEIAFIWDGERWSIWEFGSKPAQAQPSDWRSIYKAGSLKEIVSVRIPELIKTPNVLMYKDDDKDKPLVALSYNSYPTSTKVKFTGERRKTSEPVIAHIAMWLTTLGKPKDLAQRFEYEYKFIEAGIYYWIPVQNPLPDRLASEAKANDEITVYLSWLGINYDSGKPVLLAIVNEFEKVPKQ